MIPFRRDVLKNLSAHTDFHAGLWLDKYLKDDNKGSQDGKSAKDQHVLDVAGIQTPARYGQFFESWKRTLAEVCGAENYRVATVLGRLAINLGSEAVLETSIALHRTYGVPFIPGSALKGLAAHYVMQYLKDDPLWAKNGEAFVTLFGDTTSAGYVTFFDALYVPGSGKNGQALWKDVITVHHPDYYQGVKPDYLHGKEAPPADWDSPVPIPFLTATGSFLVAVSGPKDEKDEWVNTAFDILELALEREGIGAKTNSGYGRMTFKSKGTDGSAVVQAKAASREVPEGYERGVVKKFMDVKGYGFIQPDMGGPDLFVHITELEEGVRSLQARQKVIFKRGPGNQPGKEQAFDVRLDG